MSSEAIASRPGPPIFPAPARRLRSRREQLGMLVVLLLLLYLGVAYLAMPAYWKGHLRRHPSLADIPNITHTKSGIPGDPLNVALIGTRADLLKIMRAAHWHPADPLSLRSDLRIAADTVFKRPYSDAPVSNLYLWGREEDLAFEQASGSNPRQRHHVRFWRSDKTDPDGRPLWMGAATYDRKAGFSTTTGQITHHIAADVDAERDKLFADLKGTLDLVEVYGVPGFHQILTGRNGGGDRWYTDGVLEVGVIRPGLGLGSPGP